MHYKVTFTHNHVEVGTTTIVADSAKAAREQAERLEVEDIEEWDGLRGELYVDAVTEIDSAIAERRGADK